MGRKKIAIPINGKKLKRLLKEKKITQEELAKKCYLTRETINKMISNDYVETLGLLDEIAQLLDVKPEYLKKNKRKQHKTNPKGIGIDGEKIKKLLKLRGIKQIELAEAIDCDPGSVCRFLRKNIISNIDTLKIIADELNVSIDELLLQTSLSTNNKKTSLEELIYEIKSWYISDISINEDYKEQTIDVDITYQNGETQHMTLTD